MSQDGGQVRQVTLHVNVGYAKSVLGIIKVIQFFFLMLTWVCMADCCSGAHANTLYSGRYGFYLFVTIFGWLCIPVIYVWFLLTLSDKVKLPAAIADGLIVVLCFEILWALLLVISAGLVQPIASYYGFLATTGGGDGVKRIYNPMMAAVVFGFFTFVAFFVDIVILIIKIVKGRQAVAATAANPTA
ncbi:uncharacterized protein LOC144652736 [Oculina patagonica]